MRVERKYETEDMWLFFNYFAGILLKNVYKEVLYINIFNDNSVQFEHSLTDIFPEKKILASFTVSGWGTCCNFNENTKHCTKRRYNNKE